MKWIKISDQKPPENKNLWVFEPGSGVWRARYSEEENAFWPHAVGATHWMLDERPEPPE